MWKARANPTSRAARVARKTRDLRRTVRKMWRLWVRWGRSPSLRNRVVHPSKIAQAERWVWIWFTTSG